MIKLVYKEEGKVSIPITSSKKCLTIEVGESCEFLEGMCVIRSLDRTSTLFIEKIRYVGVQGVTIFVRSFVRPSGPSLSEALNLYILGSDSLRVYLRELILEHISIRVGQLEPKILCLVSFECSSGSIDVSDSLEVINGNAARVPLKPNKQYPLKFKVND